MEAPLNRDLCEMHALLDRPSDRVARLCYRLLNSKTAPRTASAACDPPPPSDLRSTPVPSGLADRAADALVYNHDAGHAARYSIPSACGLGATLSFDYVHSRPDPHVYLRRHLSFSSKVEDPGARLTLFLPGAGAAHQPNAAEPTAPRRAAHCAAVLRTIPFAQLYDGTPSAAPGSSPSSDGSFVVLGDIAQSPSLRVALVVLRPLMPRAVRPRVRDGQLVWRASALAGMRVAFSLLNLVDNPLKARVRFLLDATRAPAGAAEKTTKPLSFLAIGRASVDILAALRSHIADSIAAGETRGSVRARLRRLVTIVTAGPGASGYPDGPAYVHIAAWDDVVTAAHGPTARQRATQGGRDAVYVNYHTPYSKTAADNHNFAALTAPYLALLMRYNDTKSVRELWDKGRRKKLKDPRNITELVAAMIVVSDARHWLWDPRQAMTDVPPQRFPSRERALAMLEAAFGDTFARELRSTFPDLQGTEKC